MFNVRGGDNYCRGQDVHSCNVELLRANSVICMHDGLVPQGKLRDQISKFMPGMGCVPLAKPGLASGWEEKHKKVHVCLLTAWPKECMHKVPRMS